jgi:exosortase A-associated hydrolase 2
LRFCLLQHPPSGTTTRGAILFVHPFAEEMNRCRRMAALQARAFADAGWSVLQIDLAGCGDSAGEFSEATWERWREDVIDSAAFLRERWGERLVLWGLRVGALLAAEAAQRIERVHGLVLWQPVLSGKQYLQQFLRLKAAAEMMAQTAGDRTGTQALREQLARGDAVEIAGYTVSSPLALGLEAAELQPPQNATRVAWLEVASTAGAELGPASRARVERWLGAGHDVHTRVVEGPQFWQTLNITEAPALIDATHAAVASW